VIGTGASGVQTTQEVGPEVEHLTVLQRTPNLCLPMGQQKLDSQTEACIKHEGGYERIFKYRRETFGGFHIDFSEKKGDDDSAEQKKEFYEKLWSNGGFNFWLASYKDLLFDKKVSVHFILKLVYLDRPYITRSRPGVFIQNRLPRNHANSSRSMTLLIHSRLKRPVQELMIP